MIKLRLIAAILLLSAEVLFSTGVEVHFIDVGQGEAVLLRTSSAAVLVDAGQNGAAYNYLAGAGIESIDLAVATHGHADHIGGFAEIFEHIPVERAWYNGQSHTTLTFERFIDGVIDSGARYYEPAGGDTLTFTQDPEEAGPGNFIPLSIEVLHPESSAGEYEGHLHDKTIVLRAVYGHFSVLITGDLEMDIEAKLLEKHGKETLKSTVLQLGHHGSSSSSSPEFLSAVGPQVVVYQAGRDNPYGHPHREVLARVEELLEAPVYGTDTHGTVVLYYDGGDTLEVRY